jgi:hypothetical protein
MAALQNSSGLAKQQPPHSFAGGTFAPPCRPPPPPPPPAISFDLLQFSQFSRARRLRLLLLLRRPRLLLRRLLRLLRLLLRLLLLLRRLRLLLRWMLRRLRLLLLRPASKEAAAKGLCRQGSCEGVCCGCQGRGGQGKGTLRSVWSRLGVGQREAARGTARAAAPALLLARGATGLSEAHRSSGVGARRGRPPSRARRGGQTEPAAARKGAEAGRRGDAVHAEVDPRTRR